MSDTLTIEVGDCGEITIRKPDFGYLTSIKMRLHFAPVPPYGSVWDDGASYDSRKCIINKWLLDETEQADFVGFMNGCTRKTDQAILKLGSTPSGFFPFGADFGDTGDFFVRVFTDNYREGSQLYDPLRWWENSITFGLEPGQELPSYTPPAAENEGSLQIGTVAHLLCPQKPFDSEHERSIAAVVTGNGDADFVDLATDNDALRTKVPLEMRTGNCAALIKFLLGSGGRGQEFEMSVPDRSFPFGIQYDSSDIYYVGLNQDVLEINHANNDSFLMDLKLRFRRFGIPP